VLLSKFAVMKSPDLAGIHFTGSTATFHHMWRTVGENITRMKYYPRIVGETGGKNFIFVHPSADVDALVVAALRGMTKRGSCVTLSLSSRESGCRQYS
jgi:acyl-CoA reductase-like NAD-dependent aldehyde dehydrogenase